MNRLQQLICKASFASNVDREAAMKLAEFSPDPEWTAKRHALEQLVAALDGLDVARKSPGAPTTIAGERIAGTREWNRAVAIAFAELTYAREHAAAVMADVSDPEDTMADGMAAAELEYFGDPERKTGVYASSHAEDQYVSQAAHLNCPFCGGSGHVDDVAVASKPVAFFVNGLQGTDLAPDWQPVKAVGQAGPIDNWQYYALVPVPSKPYQQPAPPVEEISS